MPVSGVNQIHPPGLLHLILHVWYRTLSLFQAPSLIQTWSLPDQLGGWSGQHDGVIGIHNYMVQLYTVLDKLQFSFFSTVHQYNFLLVKCTCKAN